MSASIFQEEASEASAERYQVAIAGSGEYSVQCAEALAADPRFQIVWSLTPGPKPVGRKQTLTPSALEAWSQNHRLPTVRVTSPLADHKPEILNQNQATPIDFLLVVSFGYLLPSWLLGLPRLAPVNVHPSALPRWRGSSPAQFALLYGDDQSAVSIMKMNTKFDQGAIIAQLPLPLTDTTTQPSYYDQAFALAADYLPDTLHTFAQTQTSQPQPPAPADLPTARRLTREDGFVPHEVMEQAQTGADISADRPVPSSLATQCGPVLAQLLQHQPHLTASQLVDRAFRALTPWPGIWTTVPHYKGKDQVRLKIHDLEYNATTNRVTLNIIQYDGEKPRKV